MKLVPAVPPQPQATRSFNQRLMRAVYISMRNWKLTVKATIANDQALEEHLWRRLCQHEKAKRKCL